MSADFLASIQKSLEITGFPAENLELEIAESVVSLNIDVLREIISSLKAAEIRVQIDDFGKGNSTLQYLNQLQVNALKIDQAFIEMISNDERDSEIPGMIISLAHRLGFKAVAEGIESSTQLSRLRKMGCDSGQGYLLCGSLENQAAERLLAALRSGDPANSPWQKYW
jgi:EAL domain-containing protein (putative c-di-GMP-specific phosphodiesterase class I)